MEPAAILPKVYLQKLNYFNDKVGMVFQQPPNRLKAHLTWFLISGLFFTTSKFESFFSLGLFRFNISLNFIEFIIISSDEADL